MRISAITNYSVLPKKNNVKNDFKKLNHLNQPSFTSAKGAAIGGVVGAILGAGVIIGTGGLAMLGTGAVALASTIYGGLGAATGDVMTKDDNK